MKKIILLFFIIFSLIHKAQILYDNGAIYDDTSRFELDGRKWNKSNLTYYFENLTSDISNNNAKNAINQAFTVWSNASNLTFTEVFNSSNADIVIKWAVGNHGDGNINSFDGQNGILAHAFYPPPNSGNLAGDIHFDDDEIWTNQIVNNSFQPIDLITVAIHEIGHALGLKHSQDSNAIMYPWYTGSRREIGNDDFYAIDTLYPKQIPIFGKNNICNNAQQNTYTLSLVLPSMIPVWTYSSNLTKNSDNPTSITVTPNANSSGSAFVKATFGTKEIIKDIWIGSPLFYLKSSTSGTITDLLVYSGNNAKPSVESQGITNYIWELVSGIGELYGDGINGTLDTFGKKGTYKVRVTGTNNCGSYSSLFTITVTSNTNYNVAKTTQNNYRILQIEDGVSTEINDITTSIYNTSGKEVLTTKNQEFSLENKSPGTYYLKLIKEGKVIHTQTILKN